MKRTIMSLIFFTGIIASAAPQAVKSYTFNYKIPHAKALSITKAAASKEEAYKQAAKECFNKLTGNKYPGEEKGLEIIDICANPKI